MIYLCFFWILPLFFGDNYQYIHMYIYTVYIYIYMYTYISMVYQSILYQWLCINNVDNSLPGAMCCSSHSLPVRHGWRSGECVLTKVGKCSENVPFLLKRASFDTRLFWAISGPNMFFTTLFCANGGSQSASVHRMVPYTIT